MKIVKVKTLLVYPNSSYEHFPEAKVHMNDV